MINLDFLIDASIKDIQERLESKQLTSYELVLFYLERISKYDKSGPKINSIIEINPDALAIASSLDNERLQKGPRSLLHGIPVVLKDNIDTGDKMHTSAGSLALKDHFAKEDSFVAKCLRDAGCIILGKANMTEWANFMTENMTNGYSSRGGYVKNPYGKHDVGGSSSGSAAAVSANFATASIGTETSGSILSPASQNSCVGLKPTVGLISRTGIIPISHSQDTPGPITRCVEDCAILLNTLVKEDVNDPITLVNKNKKVNYLEFLDEDGIKGLCFGVCQKYFSYLIEEKKAILNKAIDKIKDLGGEIIEVDIPSINERWDINVLLYEFKNNLNYYFKSLAPSINIRTLTDLIKFNENNKDKMLKYGQSILIESDRTSGTLTESEYLDSLIHDIHYSRKAGIDKILEEENLDVLVSPNNYGAAIPAKAGYPSITVPCGYTLGNEPVGITFTSKAYSEGLLIKVAYSFEQATKYRKPPKLS